MKQIISEGKSYLWFPDDLAIVQRFETAGLIVTPEEGNTDVLNYFHIFISADSKEKIEEFVAYQENQGQLGFKAIQVHLRPITEPIDYGIEDPIEKKQPDFEEVKASFDHTTSFSKEIGALNISIKPLLITSKPPYEIIYTIDPPVTVVTDSIQAPITIGFDANKILASYSVSHGHIQIDLKEWAVSKGWQLKDSRKLSTGDAPIKIPITREYTGSWQAEFKALGTETGTFTYDYREQVWE